MLKRLHVWNYGGFKKRVFDFGEFTLVVGLGGTGKSSLIDAAAEAFGGREFFGPDPVMAGKYSDARKVRADWLGGKPELALLLDDGLPAPAGRLSGAEAMLRHLDLTLAKGGKKLVLLDAILSPLDHVHRAAALKKVAAGFKLGGGQFILTTTRGQDADELRALGIEPAVITLGRCLSGRR